MSLPAAWVDRIFDKLSLTYGRDFTGRYEGMDINAVKSDWGHELSGFFTHPSAIAHALSNLPEKAPTVVEFRKIARKAPEPDLPRLEHSAAGKERIAAELAKLAPQMAPPANKSIANKDWARRIIDNDAHGIRSVSSLPLRMARAALAEKVPFSSSEVEA